MAHAIFYMHQFSGRCAGPCACDRMHQMEKTASILQTCKVILIYKNDSQLNCFSYQSISLLSNIDKILEMIMYNHLYKFLETNLIYSLQFGFRQKHSTSHALIHLTDKIRTIRQRKFCLWYFC